MNFRHYSFDLWLTLIKSNPEFKCKRSAYFYRYFNFQNKSLQEVSQIFRQVDLMCNYINECTGKNIDSDEMYLIVINLLNDGKINLQSIDIQSLYAEMESLLFNYLPQVYCNETCKVLDSIKQRSGTTLNILSNTGFIKGQTIRKVLKEIEVEEYFDFQIYSDEVGISKPNGQIFRHVLQVVNKNNSSVNPNEVIHVGDNPIADIKGAVDAGMAGFLINSNNESISRLLN